MADRPMTTETDTTEIARGMREAAKNATPGPWFLHDFADPAVSEKPSARDVTVSCDHPATITVAEMGGGFYGHTGIEQARRDAAFIVAAHPAHVLAVLDALAALRAERDAWKETAHHMEAEEQRTREELHTFREGALATLTRVEAERDALAALLREADATTELADRLIDYFANNRRSFAGGGTPATCRADIAALRAEIDAALAGKENPAAAGPGGVS